jgi:diacylglycerol kinase family enzyme
MAGFLIVNPRSGDESGVEDLVAAARDRGVETKLLRGGDDLPQLARNAPSGPLGMAGGDGSLAAVAEVALERDEPFVCIPFGTRNHFARDLGLDRDDPVAALDAFVEGAERRIDVGRANDRIFLNNVSLGVYAQLVHRREQHRRRRDVFARLRALTIVASHRQQLGITVDGEPLAARVILVGNNSYSLDVLSIGERERLDEGCLHLYAPQGVLRSGWEERRGARFVVDAAAGRLRAAVDGEPESLETPIEFRVAPSALRVLVPRSTLEESDSEEDERVDNPEPTEEEQEQVGTQRHADEDAMRGTGGSETETPGRRDDDRDERGE